MRILHLVNNVRCAGNGIINMTVDLACTQSAAGHDVAVASAGGEYESLLESHRVRCFRLEQRMLRPAAVAAMPARYRRIVAEFRPQVVHAHMTAGLLLAKACRRGEGYVLVSHLHNEFERKAALTRLADVVIAVSHATARSAAARGIPGHKLRAVLNGVLGSPRAALADAAAREEKVPLEGRAVLCVSGLNARRGVRDVILAFGHVAARVRDAHLHVVGDGPDRAAMEALAARMDCAGRIHFHGFQPRPRAYMRSAEVFVNAPYRDPCGQANIEAMECGCPVVATAVDGAPEVLGYGRAALLVCPGDTNAIAEAVVAVLTDPAERDRLRAGAKALVPHLTFRRVARETVEVYKEALARRRGRGTDATAELEPASY